MSVDPKCELDVLLVTQIVFQALPYLGILAVSIIQLLSRHIRNHPLQQEFIPITSHLPITYEIMYCSNQLPVGIQNTLLL